MRMKKQVLIKALHIAAEEMFKQEQKKDIGRHIAAVIEIEEAIEKVSNGQRLIIID